MSGLLKLADDLVSNSTVRMIWAAIVILLLVVIIMDLTGVGFWKKASERLASSGVEIPPDYVPGTEETNSIVPNAFSGNSTGGISHGAALRHATELTSGTGSQGDGRAYIYTTRLDEAIRSYNDAEGPAFSTEYGHAL